MSETTAVTLADLERLCWRLSGWSVEQESVDRLMAAVEAYASGGRISADALVASSGPGAAESPRGPSPDLVVMDETPAPEIGPQRGVQGFPLSLEITGTLTLVCGCTPPRPAMRPKAVVAGPPSPDVRTCRKCGDQQAITEFFRDVKGAGGRKSVCRTCEAARRRVQRSKAA